MRNEYRVVLCLMMLVFAAVSAIGQDFTIASTEYPTIGAASTLQTDTTGKAAVNVGSPGKNQTWSFTQNLVGKNIQYNFVSVGSTLYAKTFTTAGWAASTKQFLTIDPLPPFVPKAITGFFDISFFERMKSDTVYGVGVSAVTPFYSGGFLFQKPATNFPFPLVLGKKWLRNSVFNASVSLSGITLPAITKDSTWIEVDAFGKLTLPSGTYDCLRLKQKRFISLNVLLGSQLIPIAQNFIVYTWYAKNIGLILEVTSHASETNENFTEASLVVRLATTNVTGVDCGPRCGLDGRIPAGCALEQNHPNPFNPSTRIAYRIQTPAQVEIRIYSLLGREVAVLESGLKSAGHWETVWNGSDRQGKACSSGIYFCRMKATPVSGGRPFVQTRKMLLTD